MINNTIAQILCDPIDKTPLNFENGSLRSASGKVYDVIADIPVMLTEGLDEKGKKILAESRQKPGFSWAEKHWFDLNINKLFDAGNNGTLLSYGSGSPMEKKYLTQLGYQVISIDINPKYEGVDVIGDGHTLPFKDNSFDVVASFEVLEHLHSPWIAIQEISRVLKPGGVFIGSVAFMKEWHHSYFHISHWGMLRLFEYGGLTCEKIYGGQNLLGRVVSQIAPLGNRKISEKIYNGIGRGIFSFRRKLWSMRNKMSSDVVLEKFDETAFSFKEYDQIKYSPAIIFKARKPL